MSEPKRAVFEGPVQVAYWTEEWGVVYLGTEGDLLADRIMQLLEVPEDDYRYEETTIANVRITVEVLEGTLVKESDVLKARRALGLRPSETIPPPINFDPPVAPELPPPPEEPEVP